MHAGVLFHCQQVERLKDFPQAQQGILEKEEVFFSSRSEAERMTVSLPRAEFHEIPQSTHLPAQENPIAFMKVFLRFLDS